MRIALGVVIVVDLLIRVQALEAHYTDFGVLPRETIADFADSWRISLHLANGSIQFQVLMFVVAGILGLLLIVGYRTRIVTFLSWLLLLSLHNRNPLLLQGGDNLLLLLLFWSMFLPLGARFSIDSASSRNTLTQNSYVTVATVAILIQAMSVYFFSAFLKSAPEWIPDGTAIYYALHLDQFATSAGVWLRQFPHAMQVSTYFVWYLELLGPVLMFSPFVRSPLRLVLVSLFMMMEIGFIVFMQLGLFPIISIISLALFLPTEFWDKLGRAAYRIKERLLALHIDRVRRVGDSFSHWISYRRSRLLDTAAAAQPNHDQRSTRGVLTQMMAGLLLVYVTFWNVTTLPQVGLSFPVELRPIKQVLRLDQIWNMFAPSPRRNDGWFIISGSLVNGTKVDVLHRVETEPVFDKPERVSDQFQSNRWRKYLTRILLTRYRDYRFYYGRYLCRDWNRNAAAASKLRMFHIYFIEERTQPNYAEPQLQQRHIWRQFCFPEDIPSDDLT